MERIATALKVLGHTERLRILALLSHGELTVSELVQILGLSQPRVTQYINSLEDAGIIERLKEGSWVFSRLNRDNADISALIATVLHSLPDTDTLLAADRRKLEQVRLERAKSADAFFADVANDRGQLGDEYLPQADIEARIQSVIGPGPFEFMVDMGTGTGRMLGVMAGRIKRGTGIDNSVDMLKVARHAASNDELSHLSFRHGDILASPLDAEAADLVMLHQVLHYLEDPGDAIQEAARVLQPGGQLVIVDFASHDFELFREKYAHRRLGLKQAHIQQWARASKLEILKTENVKTEADRPDVCIWLLGKPIAQENAS